MFNRLVKRFLAWVISLTFLAPTFITPFQAYAEEVNPILEITSGPTCNLNDIISVRVTDTGVNLDPMAPETIMVKVVTAANSAGTDLVLTETGVDTYQFGGNFRASAADNAEGTPPEILVSPGETIHISYGGLTKDIGINFPDVIVTVTDSTDTPLSGIHVQIRDGYDVRCDLTTSGDGTVRFNPNLGNGNLTIYAYPADLTGNALGMMALPLDNGVYKGGDFTLTLTQPALTISVKNPDGSDPEFGGGIELKKPNGNGGEDFVLFDGLFSNSTFNIPSGLPDGDYNLYAHPEFNSSYSSSFTQTLHIGGGTTVLGNGDSNTVNYTFTQVAGSVTLGDEIHTPAAGQDYDIFIAPMDGQPGGFSIPKEGNKYKAGWLQTGNYQIKAISRNQNYADSQTVDFLVTDTTAIRTIDLELTRPQIAGTVEAPGGVTLNNGRIEVLDSNFGYKYDVSINNGAFGIGGLEDGTYYLRIRPDNAENTGHPAYDAYHLYKIVMEGSDLTSLDGASVEDPHGIVLAVEDRQARIDWIDTMRPGDDRLRVHIANYSMLGDPGNPGNNVGFEITANGNTYDVGPGNQTSNDTWQDKGDIEIRLNNLPTLEYGNYTLNVTKNGNPIPAVKNNDFFVVSGTSADPVSVALESFAGLSCTVDVTENKLGKVYPWTSGDTVYVRLNQKDGKVPPIKLDTHIDQENLTLSFNIPEDAEAVEGTYYLDFFKVADGKEIILAQGDMDIGTTRVARAVARWGENTLTIQGDYLRAFAYPDAYAEITEGGEVIARSTSFNNFWGDLQWFVPFRFEKNGSYKVTLSVPSKGLTSEAIDVDVVPYLSANDPVIELGSNNTVQINGNWAEGAPIKLNLHPVWDKSGADVKALVGQGSVSFEIDGNSNVKNIDGFDYGLFDNNFIVDITDGTTGDYLGYTMLYASHDTAKIIAGTVNNSVNSAAMDGIVRITDKYNGQSWESVVTPEGKYYFNRNQVWNGDFRLVAQPAYDSGEAPDYEEVKLLENGGIEGNFDLQYNAVQISGNIALPGGTATNEGGVNVFNKNGDHLYSVDIHPDSSFVVGGLDSGTNYISAWYSGPGLYMDSLKKELNVGTDVDAGILLLTNPQFSVAATYPDGTTPLKDFSVEISKAADQQRANFQTRYSEGVIYVGNMEPGSYNLYISANQDIAYAHSASASLVIDGDRAATPGSFELAVKNPNLTGNVVAPNSTDVSHEGYVEAFKFPVDGEYDPYGMEFVDSAPIKGEGKFYMNLPEGDYLLRACLNDNSQYFRNYSVSRLTPATVPVSGVTLQLNDKSMRFRGVGFATVGQNDLNLRLIGDSSVPGGDFSKFTVQLLDSQNQIIDSSDEVRRNDGSYDYWKDDVDLSANFYDGINIKPGQYKVKLFYNGSEIPCDDTDGGMLDVYFPLDINPGIVKPSEVNGKTVSMDIRKGDATPYPWQTGDVLSIRYLNSQGYVRSTSTYTVTALGAINVTLPNLGGDGYRIDVVRSGKIVAIGYMTVGSPEVGQIYSMTQGDDGITLEGKNLFAFDNSEIFKAQICDNDGKVLYESSMTSFDGYRLYVDFNNNLLPPGQYVLKVWYENVLQTLPGDGKFDVISKLDVIPTYLEAGYGPTLLTLVPKQGFSRSWNAGDEIGVTFRLPDGRGYAVDPAAVTATDDGITFTLPSVLTKGQYWVSVERYIDGNAQQIGAFPYDVVDFVEVEGTVLNAGDHSQAVPYAEIDIFGDKGGMHVEADKDGRYHIFGLPEGVYTIKATGPDGEKWITPGDESVTVNGGTATKDLYLAPASVFSGTVSLPESEVAPEGGYHVGILVWSPNENDKGNQNANFWFETVIPEGSRSVDYKISVSGLVNDYIIGVWPATDKYINSYYYKESGIAFSKNEATVLSGNQDRTGLNINITGGRLISGTVYLPAGVTAPAGGINVSVNAVVDCDTPTDRDDYAEGIQIVIKQGQNSATYALAVPANPEGQEYRVSYRFNDEYQYPYIREGFYSSEGTIYSRDLAATLDMRTTDRNGIDLTILNPQLKVSATTPAGDSINDFGLDIQPVNGEYSRFETSFFNGETYVWGLAPGDYYVYAMTANAPLSQSEPGIIHINEDGSCDENELTLELTDPKLIGEVKTPENTVFIDGYVQVFKGSLDNLQYIDAIPIRNDGTFYLGGLPDGDYLARACVSDNSASKGIYSASSITAVQLQSGDPGTVTLTLNDMAPRFRFAGDYFTNQDRMTVRLINVSSIGDFINSINDFDNMTAEIQDLAGNVRMTVGTDNLIIHSGSYDPNFDEVDLEIVINDGMKLNPGKYRLVLKNGDQALSCDTRNNGEFNLYYGINTVPYVILPEEVSGAEVTLELQSDGLTDPLTESSSVSVKLYDGDGQAIDLQAAVSSGRNVTVTLPAEALQEGWYMFEVSINGTVSALGGLEVGYPGIDVVNDMNEGDGGIALMGTNLEFFNGNPSAYAKILKTDGTPLYISDYMNFDGQNLYIEFGAWDLNAGDYILQLGYDDVAMTLPNDGKFSVVSRVNADPTYISEGYGDNVTVALNLRPGQTAPWSVNDTLNMVIYGKDTNYIVENTAITKGQDALSFKLPSWFKAGFYGVNVVKLENGVWKRIAASRFYVTSSVQVTGKVTTPGGIDGIPYAAVHIYGDNGDYWFDADRDGNYSIFGLQPGSYKMQATPPLDGKYAVSAETSVEIADGATLNQQFTLQPVSIFAGTVSLPAGATAPEGGIKIVVGLFSDTSADAGYFTELMIPAGKNYVNYRLQANTDVNDYFVGAWLDDNSTYVKENFYSSKGSAFSKDEAEVQDGSSDRSGLNITLAKGDTISGKVTLPAGINASADGIKLDVYAIMTNGTDDKTDDYVGSVTLAFPKDQYEASFTMALPRNPAGQGYFVAYALDGKYGLEPSGYYSDQGTVYNFKEKGIIDMETGNKTGIDLAVSIPLAPEVIDVAVTEPGQQILLIMSKPLADLNGTYGGFTLEVDSHQYTGPFAMHTKDDKLVIDTGFIVFKDAQVIKLSYAGSAGIKSRDGLDLAAFSDMEAVNKSVRVFTVTGAKNGDLYNHDVTLTASGIDITMDMTDNGVSVANGTDEISHIFGEGAHHVVVTGAGMAFPFEMTFTIDKTMPGVTIADVTNDNLYNSYVTPTIAYTDNMTTQAYLESHATAVLTKDGAAADYTPGDEIAEDGVYVLTVKTVDEAGNESSTATVSFTIDTAAPAITLTGCSNALDHAVTPVITFSDDCVAGTKSATLNGEAYDLGTTPAIVNPGSYVLIVTAKDAAGNTATEQAEFVITWDESQPVINTNIEDGKYYENITPAITLTGGTNSGKYTFAAELTKPDGSKATYTQADTLPAITTEGVYTLKITAVNPSWKEFGSEQTVSFTIDSKAPVIGITAVTNNGLYSGTVKPVISFSDTVASQAELTSNATIELKRDGSVVAGYKSGDSIAADGAYVLTVTTYDANSHTVQKVVSFAIDTTKPVITITGCNNIENDPNGIMPVITYANDCVENTKTATLNGAGYNFAAPSDIKAPGKYTLVASARDAAGNIGSAAVTFEIKWDTSVPVISTPGLTGGLIYESVTPAITLTGGTNVNNYTWTAKLTKPDGTSSSYVKGDAIPAQIAEGAYKLEITAVNPGYTVISSSKSLNFTVDNRNPAAAISGIENNGLYNKPVNPTIAFTDNVASQSLLWNNATVALTKDGSAVTSYKAGDVIAADGCYVLTAETKDALNHASNAMSATFTIDATKPVITLTGALNGYTYKDQDVTLTAAANEGTLSAKVNGAAADIGSGSLTLKGADNAITQYNVVLTAADDAGNTATMELGFTIDRLPVNIVVNGITEGQIINYNPAVTFTTFNGTNEQAGTTATLDGAAYNPNTTLAEGQHTFIAGIVLAKVTYSKTIHFTVDKTAPIVSSVGAGKNGAWATQPIFAKSGDVLGIRAKVAEINGVQEVYATLKLGTVDVKVPLTLNQTSGYYEGSNIVGGGDYANIALSVYATDKAGNVGSNKSYANPIAFDNSKPVVTRAANPAAPDGKNGIFIASGMNVVLTAGSGETITYTFNGVPGSAAGSKTLTPVQGDNILVYKAQDQAGNISDEKVYVFKYDSVKPADVTVISPATPTGLVNSELLKITGKVSGEGAGAKVVLKRGSDIVATTDVRSDNTFEFSGVRLLEGANSFTLTAIDYAGNESVHPTALARTLDTISPLLDIQKSGSLYTVTSNEDISGAITANFNGADVDAAAITKVSTTEFTIESPEEIEGLNTLNVWATDVAGNTGTGSYSSTYIPAADAQDGLDVGENTSIDIPQDTFTGESIQMVVRTVDIQGAIDYKPITAPVQFDFSQDPTKPIVVRIQIGIGLTGVMLMHVKDNGDTETPIPAKVTTSAEFDAGAMALDDPYYLSDTGELVFKTVTFSAYGAVIDNTPPAITVPANNITINKDIYETAGQKVILTGTITDASNASISSVLINGAAMDLTGIDAADLDKTFSIPLAISDDGTYEVVITAKDGNNNISDPKAVTYHVDINDPVLTATCGTTLTNRNTVDITVDVSELSAITLNGTQVTTDDGRFNITASLNEGLNTLNVAATDAYGNTATAAAISVTRDTQPPTIAVTGVNDGDTYGAAVNITVNVAGEASKTITLDGKPFAGGNCAEDGLHTLVTTAVDAAGNTAGQTIRFTIDTSVPVVTVTGAVNNGLYTADKTLDISTSNADTLAIAKSVNGGAPQNVAVPDGDTTYSLNLSTQDGQQNTYVVVVTARKTVGAQIRFATTTINLAIDKKNPGLTLNAPSQTESATADITGSVDELSDIYLDGALFISNKEAGSFTISGRPLVLGNNTFSVKAVDLAGHETTKSVTVKRVQPAPVNPPDGGGLPGGGGGGFAPPPILPQGGIVTGSIVTYNPKTEGSVATTSITSSEINEAFGNAKPDASGVKTIELDIARADNATAYVQELPASVMQTGTSLQRYAINTEIASMTIPGNMFQASDTRNKTDMGISIGLADKNRLSKELKAQIGDRPVLELTAMADGKPISWSNASAPVTITVDYTPTTEELKDTDHIVVLYIDGSGKAVQVPNGKYDPAARKITFTTTHFSRYAVAYVSNTFEDIGGAYAKSMIEALASKGFYNWISGTKFNPNRNITRAEFLYLVVTALDLHADFITNFSDVKPSDYYYEALGTAKILGITSGVGNNNVGASMGITRQDMSTMLVRALKIAGKNYPNGNASDLGVFNDSGKIAGYAKDSLATLVKAGILVGSNKILDPNGNFTMQHAAVVIYKIYKK